MVTSLQDFLRQLLPLYPSWWSSPSLSPCCWLDFFVERRNKAILGWYSLIGIVIAASMTVKLMGTTGSSSAGPSCSTRSHLFSNWPSMLLRSSVSWSR